MDAATAQLEIKQLSCGLTQNVALRVVLQEGQSCDAAMDVEVPMWPVGGVVEPAFRRTATFNPFAWQ